MTPVPISTHAASHSTHHGSTSANGWLLVASTLAAGLIIAPAVLPAIGIGSYDAAAEIASAMHGTGFGTGLAGFWNEGLSHLPVVGSTLAAGGTAAAAIAGGLGLGGLAIGSWLSRQGSTPLQAAWGSFIRNAALATTMLISLPSLLTGISIGIAFLAHTLGGLLGAGTATAWASTTTSTLAHTLGTTGGLSAATSATSLGALTGHLVTCGSALAPLAGSAALSRHTLTASPTHWQERLTAETNTPSLPQR